MKGEALIPTLKVSFQLLYKKGDIIIFSAVGYKAVEFAIPTGFRRQPLFSGSIDDTRYHQLARNSSFSLAKSRTLQIGVFGNGCNT